MKRLGLLLLALSVSFAVVVAPMTHAASASDWRAGRIIDDALFTDKNAMSVAQIQAFLNAKVPTCDTWGTQPSEFGGGTRAQYGASHGNPAPFTCLKDYYEVSKTAPGPELPANNYGGKPIPAGAQSAAQHIWNAAQKYNISPKVLLVKIATESAGPLTTDDWPFLKQYTYAMGSHCPDSGPGGSANCDANYAGFSIQMDSAADLMRWYLDGMNQSWWPYKKPGNNSILYNPNTGCGSSNVFIQTMATAALYTYTPYQPNQAALNNMYSTGDGCSAYGNRNFWRVFSDWFGSPNGGELVSNELRIVSPITRSPLSATAGEITTISYVVKNFSSQSVTYDASVVQCRFNGLNNCDPAWATGTTFAPGEQRTLSQDVRMPRGGSYTVVPYFQQNGIWSRFGAEAGVNNYMYFSGPDVRLTSPITRSPAHPVAGEPVSVTYTVRNFGEQPVYYQTSVLQCRFNTSTNCDSAYDAPISIAPGASRSFTHHLAAFQGGVSALVPYYMQYGIWYRYGGNDAVQLNTPDMRLMGPIVSNPAQPIPGQPMTLTYTIKNASSLPFVFQGSALQCRINSQINCDPTWDPPYTYAPGEERTFTINYPPAQAGSYMFTPYFLQDGVWFRYVNGANQGNLRVDVPAYVANMRIVGAITSNPTQPAFGQSHTVTYTVKNFGDKPAIYQTSVLQCRLNGSTNCDPQYDAPLTINAGDQRTFTVNFPAVSRGTYTFKPFYMQNNSWYLYGSDAAGGNLLQLSVN